MQVVIRECCESIDFEFQRLRSDPKLILKNLPSARVGFPKENIIGSPSVKPPAKAEPQQISQQAEAVNVVNFSR
jgi:hypothetical protein